VAESDPQLAVRHRLTTCRGISRGRWLKTKRPRGSSARPVRS